MSGDYGKRNILIVDDAETNCRILTRIFQEEYGIILAQDGEEALEILRESEEDIALILLDIVMPKMDGFEVLRQLGADESLSGIPVVVVSANGEEETYIKALDLGADDIVTKPFSARVILHRVKNIITKRENDLAKERSRLYEMRLAQQEAFIQLSERDGKTTLYNKGAFCRHTQEMLQQNADIAHVMLRFDIDRFKVFNDLYGNKAGDGFLLSLGKALAEKESDAVIMGHWDAAHAVI